jgi:glycosyltransferase involved in cell wall biosynthesis
MKQVLIVTYYFPPLGGAGVQRPLKFVKYLGEFGWHATVLTVHPPRSRLLDSTLSDEVPSGVNVIRTPAPALPAWLPWRLRSLVARWLLLVDEQIGWLPIAARRGREMLRTTPFDLVFSTSAPYTCHLVAARLIDFPRLPWIADFRDPWMGNFASAYPTHLHKRIAARFEQQVITGADRVLVVSDPMRSALLERYPELPENKVITLTNGFDPADFANLQPAEARTERFTITYTGSFYANAISPESFLAALRRCLDDGRIPRQKICVNLVGNVSSKIEEQVNALALSDVVHFTGYLPHRKSIACLLESDLLLLIIGDVPGSQVVFTGKIFEYLAAKKPILALTPDGAAADLIRTAEAGEVVAPDDINAITNHLSAFYSSWERGSIVVNSRSDIIQRYDRRLLTQRLALIMDNLV